MYEQEFFITEKVSNNEFNFERRDNKKIYVPRLKTGEINDVHIGEQIVFEDFDDDGKLHQCNGLENFVLTKIAEKPAYIFDNHNHAFAFWCNERRQGNLQDGALLIHIDQHKDTRTPASFISKKDAQDPQKVFQYTNTVLNVGNFIPAAQHIELVNEIIFIDSQASLENMAEKLECTPDELGRPDQDLILDIDLDFFAPDSDYIGNELKLKVIQKLIPRAAVITFATSPYFIDQKLAIEWLRLLTQAA